MVPAAPEALVLLTELQCGRFVYVIPGWRCKAAKAAAFATNSQNYLRHTSFGGTALLGTLSKHSLITCSWYSSKDFTLKVVWGYRRCRKAAYKGRDNSEKYDQGYADVRDD